MPNAILPIPNVDEGVVRPLVNDIVEQLKKIFNLENVDNVLFMNDGGQALTANSAVGEDGTYARFEGKQRFWVEAEEEYNQEGWASMVVERLEHQAVFEDKALGITITPVYVPTDLTIKVRFVTPQRDDARKWRDNLASRIARLQNANQHTVSFSMDLPPQVWGFIENVWLLRENVAGYQEPIDEYIKNHSDNDLTMVSEASGKQRNLTFRRRMARINATYDVSPLPERPNFDSQKGLWECSLNYKLTFDRPMAVAVRYPIMVHNQFLPEEYIVPVNDHAQDMSKRAKKLSESMRAFSSFESYSLNESADGKDCFIQIPSIDDFVPPVIPKFTCSAFIGMLKIDEPNPKSLLNLGELGDVWLDEDVLDFIRNIEYPYLNKPYQSFLYMQFYRGRDLMHPETISCLSNLDIVANEELSLREIYRVRLSLVVDITKVTREAIARLNTHPKALLKIISAINCALRCNVDLQHTWTIRPPSPWMLSKLWQSIAGVGGLPQINIGRQEDEYRSKDTAIIPDHVWDNLKNFRGGGMRNVQIMSTIAHSKEY